jgi:hypothetical protein
LQEPDIAAEERKFWVAHSRISNLPTRHLSAAAEFVLPVGTQNASMEQLSTDVVVAVEELN